MQIDQGAEAIIEKHEDTVRKSRIVKDYRHPDLDLLLRKSRTRREAKILQRLKNIAPTFVAMDDKEMTIDMQFLSGQTVKDALTQENYEELGKQIGLVIKRLHDQDIIHGDLTTSNMIVHENQVKLIDFGLALFSEKLEDKAVDLHVLKHALAAKHPAVPIWRFVLESYKPSKDLLDRFAAVEKRGRYKRKTSKQI